MMSIKCDGCGYEVKMREFIEQLPKHWGALDIAMLNENETEYFQAEGIPYTDLITYFMCPQCVKEIPLLPDSEEEESGEGFHKHGEFNGQGPLPDISDDEELS